MISLNLAQQLKEAGLVWKTAVNDFFGIPERGMDERVFVLSDMMANMEVFRGWPVVAFHGAAEWALDYIFTHEVVWLPSEEQLRQILEERLLGEAILKLQLTYQTTGYVLEINFNGADQTFEGSDATEAYGQALLHILQETAD